MTRPHSPHRSIIGPALISSALASISAPADFDWEASSELTPPPLDRRQPSSMSTLVDSAEEDGADEDGTDGRGATVRTATKGGVSESTPPSPSPSASARRKAKHKAGKRPPTFSSVESSDDLENTLLTSSAAVHSPVPHPSPPSSPSLTPRDTTLETPHLPPLKKARSHPSPTLASSRSFSSTSSSGGYHSLGSGNGHGRGGWIRSLFDCSPATRWLLSWALQVVVILLLSQKSADRTFKIQPYLIEDPFFDFPIPEIRWIDPTTLVPHEHTSAPHLQNLLHHLHTLSPDSPLPIPVCTSSEPRIILDGHHRVAASLSLGLTRIPVWVVDDAEEDRDWDGALIKVYAARDGSRMRLREVVEGARAGRVDWGIKGTRHVAVVSSDGKEVTLERVTPRVLWGVWAAGGRPCGRYWTDWRKVGNGALHPAVGGKAGEGMSTGEAVGNGSGSVSVNVSVNGTAPNGSVYVVVNAGEKAGIDGATPANVQALELKDLELERLRLAKQLEEIGRRIEELERRQRALLDASQRQEVVEAAEKAKADREKRERKEKEEAARRRKEELEEEERKMAEADMRKKKLAEEEEARVRRRVEMEAKKKAEEKRMAEEKRKAEEEEQQRRVAQEKLKAKEEETRRVAEEKMKAEELWPSTLNRPLVSSVKLDSGHTITTYKADETKKEVTASRLIASCENVREAFQVFRFMLDRGLKPNANVIISLIALCNENKTRRADIAVKLWRFARQEQVRAQDYAYNVLATTSSIIPDPELAQYLRDRLESGRWVPREGDHVLRVLKGLAKSRDLSGARALLNWSDKNLPTVSPPEPAATAILLNSAGDNLDVTLGEEVKQRAIAKGLLDGEMEAYVATAVIAYHGKCGDVDDALKVFESVKHKTLAAWNAMLNAYLKSGMVDEARAFLQQLLEQPDVRPDFKTCWLMVKLASESNDGAAALQALEDMQRKHGITPHPLHHEMAVIAIARSGDFDGAEAHVAKHVEHVGGTLCMAILGACRRHVGAGLDGEGRAKAIAVGQRFMDKLRSQEPLSTACSSAVVMMADIHRLAGDVDRANETRAKLVKRPLSQATVVKPGERKTFETEDAKDGDAMKKADVDEREMRERGLIQPPEEPPHNSVDRYEERAPLRYHPERLAISHALSQPDAGKGILIVKNMRIGWHNHSAIAALSEMAGRELLVFDQGALHRFKDGKCSCKGFW
ncbi:hypothetical protein HK101_001398 [Irineochytrium annulatum]|nr:hypothetical protein HK101_001398 [Irineochytrium annulatum]